MVRGLDTFRDHFKGYEDCYILIGGTACELWMVERGMSFRATKDLDVVLIVEALNPGFFSRFWEFVLAARYKSLQQSERRPEFYRFNDTDNRDYPIMIELLSRNALALPERTHLTPIPSDEDISSLSAILLDDAYYDFVLTSRIEIDSIPTIPAHCIIPLKARAYLDLVGRRSEGDRNVRGEDIRKHRNDVFRLSTTLAAAERFELPVQLAADLTKFLGSLQDKDWPAIRSAVGKGRLPDTASVLSRIRDNFGL